jgi:two-component system CheB/CheR fusion protein
MKRKRPPRKSKAELPGKAPVRTTDSPEHPPEPDAPRFPVVGVGASAGGLEAFTQLLKGLPDKPGMAFVLIPHLDPTHESAMTELLSRATPMPVQQVHHGIRLKPSEVFVIPPGKDMTIADGELRLAKRELRGIHLPIDTFLSSLAAELHSNAIGVILSGTASDGTIGASAIKSEGGITFAQEPHSAKYDGMPNSAISAGCIDFILPPEKIAEELMRIGHHPYVTNARLETTDASAPDRQALMARIFRLMRQVCKVDFSDYKPATVRRRVLRRMALNRLDDLGEYTKYLQDHRDEVEALYNDILINVTRFFRDAGAFESLKETVYPAILRNHSPAETVRIWVPGCSTGEEAYSHAISLLEYVTDIRAEVSIQIFGTDLSIPAIQRARAGVYRDGIRADVSAERIKRFFNKVEGGFQISKYIRDMCIFANQNVFSDPPFSHIDIVSCRNVLIYLSQNLQKRVVPIFHYALRPGGFLMVGNTEGLVGSGAELFDLAHRKWKIYTKKAVATPAVFGIQPEHFDGRLGSQELEPPSSKNEANRTPAELHREADRLLLSRYVPAAALVGNDLEVLQTRGHASRYLELPAGKVTLSLLKMLKPGLLFDVQSAVSEARTSGAPVRRENLQIQSDHNFTNLSIEVIPIQAPSLLTKSFLIVFEEDSADLKYAPTLPASEAFEPAATDKLNAQLQRELAATKEYQQSIIEALEASNEELQSANEEIQSGNEELQSTNEELQTSKEELESANEELNTVNEEMQSRNFQLTQTNNDLQNLLTSVNLPIIMVNSDLSVRRFTPKAAEMLGLGAEDVGRPLVRVNLRVKPPQFEAMMLEVMRDGRTRQREFNIDHNAYQLRVSPYRTSDNRVEGVVAGIFDITGAEPSDLTPGRSAKNKSRTAKSSKNPKAKSK